MRIASLFVASLLMLSACAQSNSLCSTASESSFLTKPKADSLELNITTPQEIRSLYGAPVSFMAWHETHSTIERPVVQVLFPDAPAQGSYKRMLYVYQTWKDTPHNTVVLTKRLRFTFYNDRLASYSFASDFANDSSSFNEAGIRKLVKHKSTRADVVNYLGEPAGRAIYPLEPIEGGEKLTYLYLHAEINKKRLHRRHLEILINAKGLVEDFRSNDQELPLTGKSKK